jgi:anion-transporting  ArsA/GET3 family ATPase
VAVSGGRYVQVMEFSCIVFDTAPTGHTLRLLSFPTVLQKGLDKLLALKSRFSGMVEQFMPLLGLDASIPVSGSSGMHACGLTAVLAAC